MRRRLTLLCLALLLVACQQAGRPASTPALSALATPRLGTVPGAPLHLSMPEAPPPILGKIDLRELTGEQLTGLMLELYQRADYPAAAAAGQWAALKGGDGRYDLACCLALSSKIDEAFYYLQEAALLEGVDAVHAVQDSDLALLRSDSRWNGVARYLNEMSQYWSARTLLKTTLVVPRNYRPGKPIGVVVGLHGLGGNQKFVDQNCQLLADRLGLAFVGVNGSISLGPKAFRWSEDHRVDQAHLQAALESLRESLTVAQGKTILFGFSQGAEMAFEIAASHPDLYRGAICFSPGRREDHPWKGLATNHSGQRYLFTAGAGEHKDTLQCARRDAQWCEQAGARVQLKIYPGMNTHSFPPDFATQFGPWLKWVGSQR